MPVLLLAVAQAANAFVNGSFTEGFRGWETSTGGANAKYRPIAGGLAIDVTPQPGANVYDAQLRQYPSRAFRKGEVVRMAFRARSENSQRIEAYLQQGKTPYRDFARKAIRLTPDLKAHSLIVRLEEDLVAGEYQAGLQVNYDPGTIEVRDMSLEPVAVPANGANRPLLGTEPSGMATTLVKTQKGFRMTTDPKPEARPWDHSFKIPLAGTVIPGETVLLRLRARSPESLRTNFFVELNTEPHSKFISTGAVLGPEWKTYQGATRVAEGYGPGELTFTTFLGYGKGTVEVADIEVVALGNVDPRPYNATADIYGGVKVNDTWRPAAEKRIAAIRQGTLNVRVTKNGKPVVGAVVKVRQKRHAFRFGTAVPAELLVGTGPDSDRFRAEIERSFDTLVWENNLKWFSLDNDSYGPIDEAFKWAAARKIPVRGHNLVWGSRNNLPKGLWELPDDQLKERVRKRVRDAVTLTKGRVYLWDVVNEAASERELWDRLGWDFFAEMFKLAKSVDPGLKLAYNDFDWTEPSTAGPKRLEDVIRIVKEAQAKGAPIDVIGDQAHLSIPVTPIPTVQKIWQRVRKETGAPIEITEFDAGIADDKAYAKHLDDWLTAAYASPDVSGFLLWGFWEGAHWRSKEYGHFINRDWTDRAPMKTWRALVRGKWWTKADGKTGKTGSYSVRGYKGLHEVTVSLIPGGKTAVATIDLKDRGTVTVRL